MTAAHLVEQRSGRPRAGRLQLVRQLLLRSRDELVERTNVLEDTALTLLTAGGLDQDAAATAALTVHQLSVLGTLGVSGGPQLAARAEQALDGLARGDDPEVVGVELAETALALRELVEQACSPAGDELEAALATAAVAPTGARPHAVPHILLVEDDALLVDLLRRALQAKGYHVDSVMDGAAALALLGSPGAELPDLVLLDIDLPALDGFTLLRHLRERRALGRTRVIVCTARASEPDVLKALGLGAIDHVAKPFSLPVLMARVAMAVGGA